MGVLLGEWIGHEPSRVETFRVYRGRTGKFVLHVERSAELRWSTREGKPAGWRGHLGIGDLSYGVAPGESTLDVFEKLDGAPGERSRPSCSRWSLARHASSRAWKTSTSEAGARSLGAARPEGAIAAMTALTTHIAPRSASRGLRKSFGKQVVLDGIDLDVAEGTVFALLGPNGAGKTTTVHILSTLLAPTRGEVQVAGHDLAREPDARPAAIGVTGQFSAVDRFLTGEENLRLMADLRHLGKAEGPAARRRAARAVRPGRCRAASRRDVLRRHAAPARPGDDPDRRPADHLPRRAHGRASTRGAGA